MEIIWKIKTCVLFSVRWKSLQLLRATSASLGLTHVRSELWGSVKQTLRRCTRMIFAWFFFPELKFITFLGCFWSSFICWKKNLKDLAETIKVKIFQQRMWMCQVWPKGWSEIPAQVQLSPPPCISLLPLPLSTASSSLLIPWIDNSLWVPSHFPLNMLAHKSPPCFSPFSGQEGCLS